MNVLSVFVYIRMSYVFVLSDAMVFIGHWCWTSNGSVSNTDSVYSYFYCRPSNPFKTIKSYYIFIMIHK